MLKSSKACWETSFVIIQYDISYDLLGAGAVAPVAAMVLDVLEHYGAH